MGPQKRRIRLPDRKRTHASWFEVGLSNYWANKTIFVASFLYVGKREIHEHNNFPAYIPLSLGKAFCVFAILWFNIMIGL